MYSLGCHLLRMCVSLCVLCSDSEGTAHYAPGFPHTKAFIRCSRFLRRYGQEWEWAGSLCEECILWILVVKEVKEPFLPCSHFTLPSGAVVHVGHSGYMNRSYRMESPAVCLLLHKTIQKACRIIFQFLQEFELIFCNPEAFWEYIC